MTATATLYDLTLLLSTETEDDRRAKVLSDVESAISGGGGAVERHDNWGTRPMAYRIDHQAEAEYHLLQFSGPPTLLESLSHSLRIDDGVLRFRIIKVLPGTPAAPESAPPIASAPAPAPAGSGGAPAASASETSGGEQYAQVADEDTYAEEPAEASPDASEPETDE
jgi:small subunit ribosomal protein S6